MSDAPHDQVALAALLYADDQLDEARALLEQAFVGLRDAGDLRTAAIVAGRLGELHAGSLGNEAVGRGWLERGRALLEQEGPCVEWGYWELARLACDRPDVDELTASTERALTIAREFGDVALEARALADSGLALVTRGRMREGFARLDQALAMLTAGEVGDPYVIGTSLCSLLSSCDRAGDVERAMESIRLVEAMLLQPFDGRPRVLGTHCKLAFGSVLCSAGRWTEGEAALLDAIGPDASKSRGHRVEAQSRLAELRVHQGRVDEAAELLATIEDSVAAAGPLALVHLRRGQPELARAVLRGAVKRMVNDVLRGAPLLSLLVEAEVARGDVGAALEASALLDSMEAVVDAPIVPALAALARGRIALAVGDAAASVGELERALDVLGDEHALVGATVLLELAGAHGAAGDGGAAIVAARAAHASATRLQATTLVDRAASVLRSLGGTPPRPPAAASDALAGLTARELDVLAGIQRGDTNAQIAAALYVSPKTVEHHVGRILAKLGVRTRAEAAAVAARSGG
jgi:DNA-binding CsgD family transcriptional regulator